MTATVAGTTATASGRAAVVRPELDLRINDALSAERLDEAMRLAEGLGVELVAAERFQLREPRPATLIAGGRLAWLKDLVAAEQLEVVVVDAALGPIQQRNLERELECKVIDRTGLILEIFGDRAQTAEGRLQVELAALTYQRSRLVRSWTHLERQRGGAGFMGGPGERQIELDRRRIDDRITQIKRQLAEVRRTRGIQREARGRVPLPGVALVGYTNAGKSTWFNRLSRAHVRVADQLFATLDPTIRAVRLPTGERVGLSDTVGFISDLPTQLVAAFRATLEEVLAADVIVHVRDIASPATAAQAQDVEAVLAELGVDEGEQERRVVELWNKVDRLDDQARADAEARLPRERAVLGSARTGEGEAALLNLIAHRLGQFRTRLRLAVPVADGEAIAKAYRLGAVVARHDDERLVTLDLDVPAANVERLRDFAHDRGLDLDVPRHRAAE
ncbi:MAG: GTPase HflX [Alphaproteobacteria bacterium]|nr:GTPase HflX [Alphaproteobacteria bacterium]